MQSSQSRNNEIENSFYFIDLNILNDRKRSPFQLVIYSLKTLARRTYIEISRNIQTNPINTVLNGCFFITLIYFIFKLLLNHYKIIVNPFQNEFREGAILLTTKALLSGINPYDLANQPQYTNVYGIFYHLLVYPLAKIFGLSLPIHRILSGLFIVSTCIGTFGILYKKLQVSWLLSLSASTILYAQLIYLVNPLARPDGLGLFIFLTGLYIPWQYQFSRLSLLASVVLGILGLLTKPYFFLLIPYIGVYLFLFKSKLKSIKYGLLALATLLFTVVVINLFFKSYFNNTFFAHLNAPIGNILLNDPYFSFIQFRRYIQHNLGVSIVCLLIPSILILLTVNSFIRNKFSHKNIYNSLPKIKFNLTNLDQPLVEINKPIFIITVDLDKKDLDETDESTVNQELGFIIFCLLMSMLVFFGRMGHHHGNWLIYIHQLISPFLLILIFKAIDYQWRSPINLTQISFIKSKRIEELLQQSFQDLYRLIFAGLIVLNLCTLTTNDFMYEFSYGNEQWSRLSNLLAKHQNILNSPAITSLLIEQNKPVYDSGLSEYFRDGIKSRKVFGIPFVMDQKTKDRFQEFKGSIESQVKSKQFDLLVLTPNYSPFISENLVKQYYHLSVTMPAPMLFTLQNYELEIWEPN
jgi:hypothetical protein